MPSKENAPERFLLKDCGEGEFSKTDERRGMTVEKQQRDADRNLSVDAAVR